MWLAEESVHTAHCAYGPSLPHPTPHLSWATIGRTHDNCSAETTRVGDWLHFSGFHTWLFNQPLEVPNDGSHSNCHGSILVDKNRYMN